MVIKKNCDLNLYFFFLLNVKDKKKLTNKTILINTTNSNTKLNEVLHTVWHLQKKKKKKKTQFFP